VRHSSRSESKGFFAKFQSLGAARTKGGQKRAKSARKSAAFARDSGANFRVVFASRPAVALRFISPGTRRNDPF
jgi:hypothetical protein